MKRLLAVLAVAAAAAFVLLRPAPAPVAPATGWSTAARVPDDARFAGPSEVRGRRGRAAPAPAARALVYVAGEVVKPGVYPVAAEARVGDALALAGGTRPDADLVAVNLAAHVSDGDEVVVPPRGEAARAGVPSRHAKAHGARRSPGPRRSRRHKRSRAGGIDGAASGDGLPPAAPIDINTADAQTLATVPGIGGGLAERIVAFRAANGPFASVDELLDVSGITDRRLEAIIPFVVAR